MSKPSEGILSAPLVAYGAPFLTFLALTQLESMEWARPIYPYLYIAKTIIVTLVFAYFRASYPSISFPNPVLAIVIGVLGSAVLDGIAKLRLEQQFLGAMASSRVGFDPFSSIESPSQRLLFLFFRTFGLVVLVPIIEEIFWRGLLIRYLIREDFDSVPMGSVSTLSLSVMTGLFALAHQEIFAAILWASMIHLVWYYSKSIWSCALAHGVTNFILGLHILVTGDYWLW